MSLQADWLSNFGLRVSTGFARRHDLKRHELLHTGEKKYLCEACKTPFVRLDALQRHHKSEVSSISQRILFNADVF